ncbi:MAG: SDR family oxidoreductase [Candidatus Binatia bacterium]|nr:SDR family oxidoreductase [Candidatus Binatia bacterium]
MSTAAEPLADRVALVTGASRGIGQAIALRLARAGATLVLAARTASALAQVEEAIRRAGTEALTIPTDLTNDQQVEQLIRTTLARFGRIDMLVNNAGGGPPRTPIVKARLADWEWTLRLNLWAPMVLTKLVLPSMIARRCGTIVNLCSLAGLTGKAGEAAYAAAKFALRGFSQSLFEEVREHGIKVAVICPGYVDTPLIPPNRRVDRNKMLHPDDVAEAVYHIAIASPRCCPLEVVLHPQHDPFT